MKLKDLNTKIKTVKESRICPDCKNIGYYLDEHRTTRLCLRCLNNGRFDQDNIKSQLNKGGIG
jgi:hypothetical protein